MEDSASSLLPKRNFFETDNARALAPPEVAATFVATESFWRLLSAKNHIVLGSRGSGKTVLARMLSHDHLKLFDEQRAKEFVAARLFMGIYVPARLEWVGALRNKPWQSEREAEAFFEWRLNVATCLAFLQTVGSCLTHYYDERHAALREREFVRDIGETWFRDVSFLEQGATIDVLSKKIRRDEYRRQLLVAQARSQGVSFDDLAEKSVGGEFAIDFLAPLQIGIAAASHIIEKPPEGRWMLILDEAEFLSPDQHRVINSCFRTYSGDLVYKMATMPYRHHTLETNIGAELVNGDDFEYVYIDNDPAVEAERQRSQGVRTEVNSSFAQKLFNKRAAVSGLALSESSLEGLLGVSQVIDHDATEFSYSEKTIARLKQFADDQTCKRIDKAASEIEKADAHAKPELVARFGDQIIRKMKPAVVLREKRLTVKGNTAPDYYSGASMVVLCADGNPRRMVRIFNALLRTNEWKRRGKAKRITKATQHKVLVQRSDTDLERIRPAGRSGQKTYDLLRKIGITFHRRLHDSPISSDTYGTFVVDEASFAQLREQIQLAVARGLLHPLQGEASRDSLPSHSGKFRLSYILVPRFEILPRRGRSISIRSVLDAQFDLELE